MATLVTRSGKGSPLTHAEVDANFTNLNTDKLELSGGTMTGNLSFGDNDKAIFGAGSDLEIYHSGAASFISEAGTGNLFIEGSSEINFRNTAQTAYLMRLTDGGNVRLYHAGAQKLATTSTGIDVTGTVTADGLTVDGNVGIGLTAPTISEGFQLHVDAAGNGLWGGFGNTYLTANYKFNSGNKFAGTGYAQVIETVPSTGAFTFKSSSASGTADATATMQSRMNIASNGDISFYEDTGTTAKFFWDASAERLGIGTTSPSAPLDIVTSDTSVLEINSTAQGAQIEFDSSSTTNPWYAGIASNAGGDFLIYQNAAAGAGAFTLYTNGNERMRVTSGGQVGIGTSSPSEKLHIYEAGTGSALIEIDNTQSGTSTIIGKQGSVAYGATAAGEAAFYTYDNSISIMADGGAGNTASIKFSTGGNAERMRIDSSGNLLVGTTDADVSDNTTGGGFVVTPSNGVSIAREGSTSARPVLALNQTGVDGEILKLLKDGTTVGSIGTTSGGFYVNGTSSVNLNNGTNEVGFGTGAIAGNGSGNDATIDLGRNNRRFKDLYLSGGVLNGSATALTFLSGGTASNGGANILVYGQSNASLPNTTIFRRNGSESMRIDSSGNVGIGTSSPKERFEIEGRNGNIRIYGRSGINNNLISSNIYYNGTAWTRDDVTRGAVAIELDSRTDNAIKFATTSATSGYPSEAARIDSSGNLLVGTTTTTFSDDGVRLYEYGGIEAVRASYPLMHLNRKTTDGDIIKFYKDGTTVGSIGNAGAHMCIGTGDVGWFFAANIDAILPTQADATQRDNAIDLGASIHRLDDIYATNGTIQTSDQNEKQDIAELSDAEITAAKAISKLFKTFKWNDSVAEKGDAARTHTGVIAQEVEQAMTDAGLNAGDYAFFISTTWWETQTDVPAVEADEENGVEAQEAYTRTDTYHTADEAPEGATERNRKGIRYPQLLSFIGAATEQRLTSIETRLDALEA